MDIHAVLLILSSMFAGFINSIAGSGTLIAYPVLIFLGLEPKEAIATNILTLWVGLLSGSLSFHKQIAKLEIKFLFILSLMCAIGAIVGSLALITTPTNVLNKVSPLLIFISSLILLLDKNLALKFSSKAKKGIILVGYILIGMYGTYFGAGIGIMLLAILRLTGIENIHAANAIKNILGLVINVSGALIYIHSKHIYWSFVPHMILGYIVGGYLGGALSQRLNDIYVRFMIVVWGVFVSLYLFIYYNK